MAIPVAVVLSQIGEFSFIVASLATSLGLLTQDATQALVATAIISITLNPLLYRASQSIVRRLPVARPTGQAVGATPETPDAHGSGQWLSAMDRSDARSPACCARAASRCRCWR